MFFIQLCVLASLLGVLFDYIAMIDNATVDVLSIGKDDSIVQSIPKTDQLQETKREAKAPSPATFEVDDVSRDMLDNNANNPKGCYQKIPRVHALRMCIPCFGVMVLFQKHAM